MIFSHIIFKHPHSLSLSRTYWSCISIDDVVSLQVGPFSLRVVGVVGITYLLPQDERPLCHPTVDRSVLLLCDSHTFIWRYLSLRCNFVLQLHKCTCL